MAFSTGLFVQGADQIARNANDDLTRFARCLNSARFNELELGPRRERDNKLAMSA